MITRISITMISITMISITMVSITMITMITITMISITMITWVDAADCGEKEAMVLDASQSYFHPTFVQVELVFVNKIFGPICSNFGIF